MTWLIDAWAWMEYFFGGRDAQHIIDIIEKQDENHTAESTLSEVVAKALQRGYPVDDMLAVIRSNSKIMSINEENWINAAELKVHWRRLRPHFGIMDALLLAKQKEIGATIVTGDPHFKGMKKVKFVGGK